MTANRCSVALLGLLLAGCANTLYRGEATVASAAGEPRRVVLYWPETRAWPFPAKAGPAVLLTECGAPITFVERPEGIVFRGTPGQDEPVGGPAPGADSPCGRVLGATRFEELGEGSVEVSIRCRPAPPDEFAVAAVAERYPPPRDAAYRFPVASERRWSLFGAPLPAPALPNCRAR